MTGLVWFGLVWFGLVCDFWDQEKIQPNQTGKFLGWKKTKPNRQNFGSENNQTKPNQEKISRADPCCKYQSNNALISKLIRFLLIFNLSHLIGQSNGDVL